MKLPDVFRNEFDDVVSLWIQHEPGHTAEVAEFEQVHDGAVAARRLSVAAQGGFIHDVPVKRVLDALAGLQVRKGSHSGCFRWYLEESMVQDTNAAFFIILNLLAFEAQADTELSQQERNILHEMYDFALPWFLRQCKEQAFYYPNKALGDFVCAWLIMERIERSERAEIESSMFAAASYWKTKEWGWGEHMSDHYASLMLDELSLLLLLAKSLPADLHAVYFELFQELLKIEDVFSGGPRVPAIRSYAFQAPPLHTSYRYMIRSWNTEKDLLEFEKRPIPCAHLLSTRGWHHLAEKKSTLRNPIRIFCYGGEQAFASIAPSHRLGTFSRYPIMENTDHPTWGLSWQSMPVAFSSCNTWGFLRFQTREAGIDRYHPARSRNEAYLRNALTDTMKPGISGETFAYQEGFSAIVVRRMPVLSSAWEVLSDQLVILGESAVIEQDLSDPFLLSFQLNGIPASAYFLPLATGIVPALRQEGPEGWVWQASLDVSRLASLESFVVAWFLVIGKHIEELPAIDRLPSHDVPRGTSDIPRVATILLEGQHRRFRIDPLANRPLTLLAH